MRRLAREPNVRGGVQNAVFNISLSQVPQPILVTASRLYCHTDKYPGSQAPFWGEELTLPAIVGLKTILVRLCHPIEGLGGLLTEFFWRDG